MVVTDANLLAMLDLWGASTTTLNKALYVRPIKTPFDPTSAVVLANADKADFDGSGPLMITAAVRDSFVDPDTGQIFLVIPDPAGGVAWQTTGITNLPQTIYGAALGDSSVNVTPGSLIAVKRFDEPVTLTGSGQFFDAGDMRFTMLPTPLS